MIVGLQEHHRYVRQYDTHYEYVKCPARQIAFVPYLYYVKYLLFEFCLVYRHCSPLIYLFVLENVHHLIYHLFVLKPELDLHASRRCHVHCL